MRLFPLFRQSETPTTIVPTVESEERWRRRIRNRLLGAGILIAAGAVGLPLVFDKQPRPINVDVAIEIPDREEVAPLPQPEEQVFLPVEQGIDGQEEVQDGVEVIEEEMLPTSVASAESVQRSKQANPPQLPVSRPGHPGVVAPKPKQSADASGQRAHPAGSQSAKEAARVQALLEGESAKPGPVVPQRFVVQVGKNVTVERANDMRKKLLRAGLSARIRPVGGQNSKLVRVQVGPFLTKEAAQEAQRKVQGLGLSAVVSSW